MTDKSFTLQTLSRTKWFRLGFSVALALMLSLIFLLVPIKMGGSTWESLPAFPQGETVNLPFGIELVRAAGGLTVTKVAHAPAVDQGELLTYTLIVTNGTGADITDQIIVTDTVPANTTCVDVFPSVNNLWLPNDGFCPIGMAFWVKPDLSPTFDFKKDAVVTLTYVVRVSQPLPDQSFITNLDSSYAISTPTIYDTGTSTVNTIVNAPEWQITKSVIPTPTVQPGDLLTYTLTITNSGHLTTTGNYTITDQLPDYTEYVTSTPVATEIGRSLIWVRSQRLARNDSFDLTYVVAVTRPLTDGTPIVNQTYSITGGNVFSQAFGAPITVTVDAPATLTITKSDEPYDPVIAGDILTYTLTITNGASSKGHAAGVVITDTLPTNTSLVGAGFISPTNGTTATNGSVITWTITNPDPLLVGQTAELTLAVRVRTPLTDGTILTNTYGASATNALAIAAGPAVTTTVVSTPSLEIFKAGLPEPVEAGGLLTYTIRYTNTGNADATNTVITDIFPISTTFVSESISGTATTAGRRWDVGTIPGEGGTGIITLTLAVDAPQDPGTVLTDVVTIVASEPASDTYTATNTIVSTPTLEIFKVGLPEPVEAGELLTYTIRYTNTGNADATNVVITDIFPLGTTFDSANPAGVEILGGGGRQWNFDRVPGANGGGVITLTLAVDAPQDAGTVLTDVVTIVASEPTSDTYTATNTIVSTPTLEIFKVGLPEPVEAGELLTYTIRYTNTGNADATNVVITDIFPLGTTFDSANPAGVEILGGGGRRWDVGTIPGEGGTGVITLTLAVDAPQDAGTVLTDVVTIVATEPTSDTFTATNTITSTPSLEISKVESEDPIVAGSILTYTITYTNTGNANATDVVITDTYEGDFESITATPPATVLTLTLPARIVWNVGLLPADSLPRTQVVTVTLPDSVAEGTILTNTVTITSGQAITDSDTITTEVRAQRVDLEISKRTAFTEVVAGGLITYTVTISNNGPGPVGVVVTDTFDPASGASFSACSDGCISTGNLITWNALPLLNPGTPRTLVLTLTTKGSYSGILTNTVGITFSTDYANRIDPGPGQNSDVVTTPVRLALADLQISKRANQTEVFAGESIDYTLTITNASGDVVDAVVTDTFPTEAVASAVCSSCSINLANGVVTWTITSLSAGSPQTRLLTLVTKPTYSGTLTNTAGITFTDNFSAAIETAPGDEQSTVTTTVRFPTADLAVVTKVRVGSGEVIAGDSIQYLIQVTNGGPDTVNAVITDTFPAEAVTTFICPSCIGLVVGSGVATWRVDNFAAGGTQVFPVTLQISPSYSGTLTNTVSITFANTFPTAVDPDPSNNSKTAIDTVRLREADLRIVKSLVSSANVFIGEPITYTITITNAGPDTVNAVMTDTFTNATLASHTGTSCIAPAAGPLVCDLNGFTGTTNITVVLDTSDSISGTVTNTAEIMPTDNAMETDPGDNISSAPPVTVRARVANLSLDKARIGSGEVIAGEPITYTITITNAGPDIVDAVVVDTFNPSQATFASCSDGCSNASGVVTWTLNAFNGTQSLTLILNSSSAFSGTLVNNAVITFANVGIDPIPANNQDSVSTPVRIELKDIYLPIIMKNFAAVPNLPDLIGSFSLNPPNPTAGQPVVVTVIVTNTGNAPTGDGFWVDFYIDPNPVPTVGNQRWDAIGSNVSPKRGIAWAVDTPGLGPGESRTLISCVPGDPPDPRCPSPDQTIWDGFFYSGTQHLYVYVDSFSTDGSPDGGILESNETNNRSELHFVNPLEGGAEIESSGLPESIELPPRWDP